MLMRITDAQDQEVAYRDFWMPMQDALGEDLTAFIWRYLIKDGSSVKAIRLDEIYDEVKQRLAKAKSSQVVDLLMDMHTFAGYYVSLVHPEKELNEAIGSRLRRLNRWDVKTTYPFLLNLFGDYRENRIAAQDLCAVLDVLESFVIRRIILLDSDEFLEQDLLRIVQGLGQRPTGGICFRRLNATRVAGRLGVPVSVGGLSNISEWYLQMQARIGVPGKGTYEEQGARGFERRADFRRTYHAADP